VGLPLTRGIQAIQWNIALERDRIVRGTLNALWLRGLRTPAHWRYGVGIVVALAPSLLRVAMNPYWGLRLPYVFYFPATMFTALFSGLGPAWVGIGICAVMTAVWVLPPIGSVAVSNTVDLVGLIAFIVADGIIAWIGASYRDLIKQSERQNAELAVQKHALERAVGEATAANRTKDNFLAVLSHELRTPLATIMTGLRVLRQIGGPDERARRTREAIERQGNHLSKMVDDLVDMKKIMTSDVALERKPCDLADAVAGFLATFNEAGRVKQHTLSVDAEPVWVNGDAMRLQQIISNLLSNAVKYTPAGGAIHISVKREGGDAVLRVRDTGVGISPALAPRMFELFVQGDSGARSGLGIGLAIVRRLVEVHGGTVEASSDGPRKGSTFTVRLPRVSAPSE
jgi:signal transduction histidine kinase